jgi:uncharacterized protein with ParB-like and HNH nuclease domain
MSNQTQKRSLRNLLREGYYRVPRHQRGYSWTKQEVDDFLSDIEYISQLDREYDHYMGTVVIYKDPNSSKTLRVVDGQQRLTTITLFFHHLTEELEYVYNKIQELGGSNEKTEEFKEEYREVRDDFIKTEVGKGVYGIKTRFLPAKNRNDENFEHEKVYRDIIMGRDVKRKNKYESPSSYRIIESSEHMESWFFDIRNTVVGGNPQIQSLESYGDKLIELANLVGDKFTITQYLVEDYVQAGRMFNVINNRGKSLTVLDLVKSHTIYQLSHLERDEERLDKISEQFAEVKQNITPQADDFEKHSKRFMRLYWPIFYSGTKSSTNSIHNQITESEKHLDERVVMNGDKKDWINEFMSRILDTSDSYYTVQNPFSSEELTEEEKRKLYYINSLSGNEGIVSLIVSILSNLDWENREKERAYMDRVLSGLESIVFRSHKVCNRGRDIFESDAFEYANKIEWCTNRGVYSNLFNDSPPSTNPRNKVLEHLIKDINDELKNTEEFSEVLREKDVLTGFYRDRWSGIGKETIHYMLLEYEISKNNTGSDMVLKTSDSIEHILPLEADKIDINEDKHKELRHRLGNLTILSIGGNASASNERFNNKKEVYLDSDFKMTQELIEYDTWEEEDIQARTDYLIQFFTQRWENSI